MKLVLIIIIVMYSILPMTIVTCIPPNEAGTLNCIINVQFLKSDERPCSKLYVTMIVNNRVYFKGKADENGIVTISLSLTYNQTIHRFIPIKIKAIINGSYYIKPLAQKRVLTFEWKGGRDILSYLSPSMEWEELNETHSVYTLIEYFKCENLTQVRDIKLLVYDGVLLDLYYDHNVKTLLKELKVIIGALEDYVKLIDRGLRLVVPRQVLVVNILLQKDDFLITFPITVMCKNVTYYKVDITEEVIKEIIKLFESCYSLMSKKLSKYGIWARIYEHKLELMKTLLTSSQRAFAEKHYLDAIHMLNLIYENHEFLKNELETLCKKCYFYAPSIMGILISFSIVVSKLIGKREKFIIPLTLLISLFITYLTSLELRVVILDFITAILTKISMFYYRVPIVPLGCLFPIPIIILFKLVDVEHTLLNLKRRRLRLFLMLTTICSVSIALIIHTSSFFGFIPEVKALKEVNFDTSFISIRKLKVERGHTKYPFDNNVIVEMNYYEAIGLLRAFNAVGYFDAEKLVRVKGNIVKAFFTNLTHLLENTKFKNSLIKYSELKGVPILISDELSKNLNLSIGSKVNISGVQYTVIGVFNSKVAISVRDVDLLPLLTKECGAILPYQEADEECRVIKVIIFSNEVKKIVNDLLTIGTTMKAIYAGPNEGYITRGTSYIIRYILDRTLVEKAYVDLGYIIESDIISQIIVSVIALLLISINAMGIIAERKKELQTMSCLGANPLTLSCYILTEAITLGLIGGVMAFIVGRSLNYFIRTIYHEITPFPGVEMLDIFIVVIFSIGFTLLGYVVPVRKSIRSVVPSHLLTKEKGKVLKVSENKIALIPFLRVRRNEIPKLVTYLSEEMPNKLKTLTIKEKKILKERDRYVIIISGMYVGLVISGVYKVKIKVEIPLVDISIPRVNVEFIPKVPPSKSDLMRLINNIREVILEYLT